jgi:hypothetical protein
VALIALIPGIDDGLIVQGSFEAIDLWSDVEEHCCEELKESLCCVRAVEDVIREWTRLFQLSDFHQCFFLKFFDGESCNSSSKIRKTINK